MTESTGRIEAIWRKRSHGGKMDAVPEAMLVEGKGIAENVDRSRRRQVTLLEREVWERVTRSLGSSLDPVARRANLLISGVQLARTRGRILHLGEARIIIGGELTPCYKMNEALPGLEAALKPDWSGGVFAQVLDAGIIRVGDAIEWEVP